MFIVKPPQIHSYTVRISQGTAERTLNVLNKSLIRFCSSNPIVRPWISLWFPGAKFFIYNFQAEKTKYWKKLVLQTRPFGVYA